MKHVPWPLRVLLWYYRKPLIGYGVLLVIAFCWGILPHTGETIVLAVLVGPWLFLLLIVLNIPFVGGLIRRLHLNPATRRNHALEHGTIYCWHRNHGINKNVRGKAKSEGFRISGIGSTKEIHNAFKEFLALDEKGRWNAAVSNHCGSMLVIAQGIGILFLFFALAVFTLWHLSLPAIAMVLGFQFFLFLALRRPLGRLLQRHRLLSLDFQDAKILEIKQVETKPLLEKGPVFFVRTQVR